MGLLTTQQIEDIKTRPIRQNLYLIVVPDSWEYDGIGDTTLIAGDDYVLDWGRRSSTMYNTSLQAPGELSIQTWSVEIANNYVTTSIFSGIDNIVGRGVVHRVYSILPSGGQSALPCSEWVGRIVDVVFSDVIGPGGDVSESTYTLTMEGVLAKDLRSLWDKDHGDDVTKPNTVTPSGIVIGSVSSGWDMSGGNVRFWAQFSTSTACTSSCRFKIPGPTAALTTQTTASGTLHQVSWTSSYPSWTGGLGGLFGGSGVHIRATLNTGTIQRVVQPPDIPIITATQASVARPW